MEILTPTAYGEGGNTAKRQTWGLAQSGSSSDTGFCPFSFLRWGSRQSSQSHSGNSIERVPDATHSYSLPVGQGQAGESEGAEGVQGLGGRGSQAEPRRSGAVCVERWSRMEQAEKTKALR